MEMYDEMQTHVLQIQSQRLIHSASRHAYLMREPTRKLSSYNRPDGK